MAEVNVKIKEAYCPPKLVEGNPCLEYIKYIIIPGYNKFVVECSEANGGEKTYKSYRDGNLHPGDLKSSLSKAINKILLSVRDHFNNNADANDLLKRACEGIINSYCA
ncbi:hypothetical protein KPL71_027175 [Citrus sinensis]|uniref:Uncharacterized protein n=1 Tax=Citrus sinensis TaxID=2711 RepID=A0ACB8I4P9_CITSI|nr:hypothetical protein KPL71_027175 [Citrus sinensis]